MIVLCPEPLFCGEWKYVLNCDFSWDLFKRARIVVFRNKTNPAYTWTDSDVIHSKQIHHRSFWNITFHHFINHFVSSSLTLSLFYKFSRLNRPSHKINASPFNQCLQANVQLLFNLQPATKSDERFSTITIIIQCDVKISVIFV